MRSIDGGVLVQQSDVVSLDRSAWRVVTKVAPTEEQWADLELAWIVVRGGVVERDRPRRRPTGGRHRRGPAEPGRLGAHRRDPSGRAVPRAARARATRSSRSATASTSAAEAGVAAVIQPGGSVRDEEVIAAADEHGLAMVFTGERHFRH